MSSPQTCSSQPVGLASVPGVGRATHSLLGTRPVLQAADKLLYVRAIPTGCPGAKRSGATPGTEVGIVRTINGRKKCTDLPIYVCQSGLSKDGACANIYVAINTTHHRRSKVKITPSNSPDPTSKKWGENHG